jgi:hypothetical protein
MRAEATAAGNGPMAPDELDELRAWLRDDGDVEVARATGLSRLAVTRMAAQLDVHAGSRRRAREALERRKGHR